MYNFKNFHKFGNIKKNLKFECNYQFAAYIANYETIEQKTESNRNCKFKQDFIC